MSVIVKKQTFNSFQAACDHFGVDSSYLSKQSKRSEISKIQLLEEKLEKGLKKYPYTYRGITHRSFSECCRFHKLDPVVVQSLMANRKLTREEALELSIQHTGNVPIKRRGTQETVESVVYPSRNAVLRAYGLTQTPVRNRMKKGMSFEEAVLDSIKGRSR